MKTNNHNKVEIHVNIYRNIFRDIILNILILHKIQIIKIKIIMTI